ncbi:PREDICTED: uncharacterized protein LOC109359917 [Lupinus angustifolius]|uniref:uncharacterized protein LOC109359917 n=1 Tax=Lupinus angustifolius TaxID=3871 RepID=UPI00092EE7A7|nr:PREDICTED: uncharacterized protein LOC109359917 [Lupinus angustifolius]
MAPYEALYCGKFRILMCWFEEGENMILGPDVVQQTTEKKRMIRVNMKVAQSRQKSYYDKRRIPLNFEEGDHVFMRVVPTTGIGRVPKAHKKYISDPSHIIEPDSIQLKNNLTFETMPLRIADQSVKALRGKKIALVKVIWSQPNREDATWEVEEATRESYPYLLS